MHFLEWKYASLDLNELRSNWQDVIIGSCNGLALNWTDTKPLPEPVMTYFIDTCAIKPWFDHYTVLWTRWLAPLRVVVTLTLQTMVSIFLNKNSEFWSHFCCIFFHTTSAMMVQYWFDHRLDNFISVWPQDRWQAVDIKNIYLYLPS